jgi:hypothetical protein
LISKIAKRKTGSSRELPQISVERSSGHQKHLSSFTLQAWGNIERAFFEDWILNKIKGKLIGAGPPRSYFHQPRKAIWRWRRPNMSRGFIAIAIFHDKSVWKGTLIRSSTYFFGCEMKLLHREK